MLLTALIGTTLLAFAPTPTTEVRPAADIIEIRAEMFNAADGVRRDQIRFSTETRGEVVAELNQDGSVQWNARSDRERLGGQDAPSLIYVRVFDGVFAIDPFVKLPKGDITATRMLFSGSSLETDRSIIGGRRRIDRVEELFKLLETARVDWLRDNGYYSARTITRSGSRAHAVSSATPEPVMKIELPADMPRGRSHEEVNSGESGESVTVVSRSVLESDAPIRISVPFGTASDVVAEADAVNAEAPVEQEHTEEIASR
ncbi:MAG: hypothetical protein KC996_06980 [Phycisphaerales bacterium]|nr:hypothetical protein [Phycisphaerales bacterium]